MAKRYLSRLAPFETLATHPRDGSIIKLRGVYYQAIPYGEDVVDLITLMPEVARQTIREWNKRS